MYKMPTACYCTENCWTGAIKTGSHLKAPKLEDKYEVHDKDYFKNLSGFWRLRDFQMPKVDNTTATYILWNSFSTVACKRQALQLLWSRENYSWPYFTWDMTTMVCPKRIYHWILTTNFIELFLFPLLPTSPLKLIRCQAQVQISRVRNGRGERCTYSKISFHTQTERSREHPGRRNTLSPFLSPAETC